MAGCPSCGVENPERARFCLECGTSLRAPTEPAAEERKVVSVLFCDLVGSTARADGADPEDVRAALRPYGATVRAEIERFGGTVEKFIGDAVMAVFGAPTAHEDDAERAVRAGLRILAAIDERNAAQPGLRLEVRIGIATGEAVVALGARPRLGEGIVSGDVVNVAARLESVAPVDGIVVNSITYRLTRNLFDYTELEPVRVKGKSEPLPVWMPTAARSRFGIDLDVSRATPFVGRSYELAVLQAAFGRAVREASVQMVTITGEPGVGKSRLLRELFAWTDDQPHLVRWRQGRCLPYGEGITFWALGEIVKAQAGILESDDEASASAKLATAVAEVTDDPHDVTWISARLAPLIGLGRARSDIADTEEAFTAWQRFLEGIASTAPAVLVVEDLHWADRPLLDFLDHLVDWSTGVALLVVTTARPELYAKSPGWGGGKRNATSLALSALTEEEMGQLLTPLLGTAVLPADARAELLDRAGGNPLYAEEFVRLLSDRGLLRPGGSLPPGPMLSAAQVPMPETLAALIAARLDALPGRRKSLLADAAVIGKVFWSGALAALCDRPEAEIRLELHELARAELIRPARRSSIAGQAEFAFWHALVRDVAYGQLPRSSRIVKHQTAAAWIADVAGDRVADFAGVLAHHYGIALELLELVGDTTTTAAELTQRLVGALLMAAERTFGLDIPACNRYYARALDLVPAGHPDRGRALAGFAATAYQLGQSELAESRLLEAIEEHRRRGELEAAGSLLLDLAMERSLSGHLDASDVVQNEAVELLERIAPGRQLAKGYAMQSQSMSDRGRYTEALRWAERALGLLADAPAGSPKATALYARALARQHLGDPGGLDDMREVVSVAETAGLSSTPVAYGNLAHALWAAGAPEAALAAADAGLDFARHRGLSAAGQMCAGSRLRALFDLGRWDELLADSEDLLAAKSAGPTVLVAAGHGRTQVLLHRAALQDARRSAGEMISAADGLDSPEWTVPPRATAALTALAVGDRSTAVALLTQVVETGTKQSGSGYYLAEEMHDLVRAAVGTGDLALASRLLESSPPTALRQRLAADTARAVLAEAEGDPSRAAKFYRQAARGWADCGHVFEHGRALLGAGRCLVDLADDAGAELLRQATRLLEDLDARSAVAEAHELIAQLVSGRF